MLTFSVVIVNINDVIKPKVRRDWLIFLLGSPS